MTVRESNTKGNYMGVHRISRPEPSLPEGDRTIWAKAVAGEFPFNAQPTRAENATRISTTVTAADSASPGSSPAGTDGPPVRYILVVQNEGTPGPIVLQGELDSLKTAFKALEH